MSGSRHAVPRLLVFLALAQLAAAAPRVDSTYATAALRDLVARAAAANHAAPPGLDGYRARVASEFAFVLHDSLGREQATQVEQLDADAQWRRGRSDEFHVVGYRTQSVGAPISMLTLVSGWTVPTLYGDRLSLGAIPARGGRARDRDTVVAIHTPGR